MDPVPLLDSDQPTAAEKPLIYIILGAAGSGRREVLADMIEGGLGEGDRAAVLLSTGETADAHDERLANISRWAWREGVIAASLPEGATHVFFVTDGRLNPVDQIEALQPWITAVSGEIGRIITVVNCQLAEKNHALVAWYEACIHFSDVALLNKREGVANKWMSEFQTRFKELCYPCLFEIVKNGRVKNPLIVLDPQARRMSHIFDINEWTGINLEGVEFGTEGEDEPEIEDEAPAKPDSGKKKGHPNQSPLDDDDWLPEKEPYFEIQPNGRRAKEIPDIAKYLE
ncbi:hypothetical protein [Rariglobus hedericola]|uniref:CobW/HypB/UreG nucleotide-binding domain-containing protein n=1 Tax=Rariglobus hedericola TaxID=2597822 RepID=A0A556QJS0_9BACT|nr:hypothetical protein [Rariglobus hedericola]TSJ76879.1 hypothetical protein FPL22_12230 [Rariglobus hedericola]